MPMSPKTLRPVRRRSSDDADALGWIGRLINFVDLNSAERTAINSYIVAGKSNGWYDNLYDAVFPMFGDPSANRESMKGMRTPSYQATTTHNARSCTFSSNGYVNFNLTSSDVGWSTSGACHGFGTPNTMSDASCFDMGYLNGAQRVGSIANGFTGFFCYFGHDTTAGITTGSFQTQAGIYLANRYSASSGQAIRYNGSGKSVIASRSDMSGGNMASAANMLGGCHSSVGTPAMFSNRTYDLWYWGLGWSQAIADLFLADTWVFQQALRAA